ncbi:hypothetical protein ON010_g9542 [Phytophthora cinnamomi]|nr:hypothetical protein ON010_g9542 [Phytophthora cinnamomi]
MDRKRQRTTSGDAAAASAALAKRPALANDAAASADGAAVDAELASINELLQQEETSQKRASLDLADRQARQEAAGEPRGAGGAQAAWMPTSSGARRWRGWPR